MFEPRFYERAAQCHLASQTSGELFLNVAWGVSGTPDTRPEIDAMLHRGGHLVPAEIKSYPLDATTAAEIRVKYGNLGFESLLVIAPDFDAGATAELTRSGRPDTNLVRYVPDLEAISAFYVETWPAGVPEWVCESLATGQHHLRFVLARTKSPGRHVVGQTRSCVRDTESITKMITRLPCPPARVLWTPQRWTIPRDAIARGSRLTPLGGYVPVDIDGDRLHRAHHACQVVPGERTCGHCLRHAVTAIDRLITSFGATYFTDVLFSGGRGVHAYLQDNGTVRADLLETARTLGVRLDVEVTAVPTATVAIPGSLHAGTMLPVGALAAFTEFGQPLSEAGQRPC